MDVGSRLQEDESTLFTWPRYTLALGTKNTAQQPTNLDSGVGRYLEEMHADSEFRFHPAPHKHLNVSGRAVTGEKWMASRLLLLRLHDIFPFFTSSLGVALLSKFFREHHLISEVIIPKAFVFGNADPTKSSIHASSCHWHCLYTGATG